MVGTDTGVGKTSAVRSILDHLLSKGENATAIKPFVSGIQDGSWPDLDIIDPNHLNHPPGRYQRPLSPYGAIRQGEKPVDRADIREFLSSVEGRYERVIIEGIGALFVPLEKDWTWIDLHAEYGWPAILIGRSGLGTINHTCLSLEALAARKIPCTGFVLCGVSCLEEENLEVAEENGAIIHEMSGVPYLGHTPQNRSDPGSAWKNASLWRSMF
ncbi:MAG: dethiobiotin synthase [Candidatus Lindowbacteria bacterium]|nr:dethiobiotin synthase [Candidatus Lindowbacteria bacterium]